MMLLAAKLPRLGWKTPLAGLVLILVANSLLRWVSGNLSEWWDAREWARIQAYIVTLKLDQVEHNNKAHEIDYFLDLSYRYSYSGKEYRGNRAALALSAEYPDPRRAYEALKGYQNGDRPLYCYVNPAIPSQSVIFRDLDWVRLLGPAVIALLFLAFGVSMAGDLLRRWSRGEDPPPPLKTSQRDPPTWKSERILPINRSALEQRLFGGTLLILDSVPVLLGGELRGRITLPAGIDVSATVLVRLQCFRRGVSRGAEEAPDRRLWESEVQIQIQTPLDGSDGLKCPLQLAIPALPEIDAADRIFWRLEAGFDSPEGRFSAYFHPPIFHPSTLPQ